MKKILNNIFFCILIFCIIFSLGNLTFATDIEIEGQPQEDSIDTKLYSNCLLLIESETGNILYEKNAREKTYPASTTKILTAVIALEKCYLNERVTVSALAVNSVPPDYTKANLVPGEEFTVEELLHALLLPSGNDAANVLAEHISGSIQEFAILMNKKASEIGLTNSNFTNPSGMHDENLYTTAYDLALIARYAMKIDKFRQIVQKSSFELPPTSLHQNNDRIFVNSNLLLVPDSPYYYEYTTGIKTGFTTPAGECLIASAKKDNLEFIAVCLNSNTLSNGLKGRFVDCKTLFEYAFANYTVQNNNLQEDKEENLEIQEDKPQNIEISTKSNSTFLRYISKIIAILIILFSIKYIFFRKKKNRRKFYKKKR